MSCILKLPLHVRSRHFKNALQFVHSGLKSAIRQREPTDLFGAEKGSALRKAH